MKHIVLAPVYVIYKLWVGFVFWFTLFLLYPLFWWFLRKPEGYPSAFRLKRFWSKLLQVLLFSPVRVVRTEPLPPPPYIMVSNHMSYLDTVFFFSLTPDEFVFLGKGELLRWPLFRLFFRTTDIPVHRDSPSKASRAMKAAATAIESSRCLAIYPEGTIPASAPKLGRFKNGAFRLAVECRVPIVPITWTSNYLILKDPFPLHAPALPRVARAIVHAPIYPESVENADILHLREQTFEVIQSALAAAPPEPKHR